MSAGCAICSINLMKVNAGVAYLLGAAMGIRGVHLLAIKECELHRQAADEVWDPVSKCADDYERDLIGE